MAIHLTFLASAFVVTCNDYIGSLRLGRKEEKDDTSMEVTHSTQLCSAIYNKFLKQVSVRERERAREREKERKREMRRETERNTDREREKK